MGFDRSHHGLVMEFPFSRVCLNEFSVADQTVLDVDDADLAAQTAQGVLEDLVPLAEILGT